MAVIPIKVIGHSAGPGPNRPEPRPAVHSRSQPEEPRETVRPPIDSDPDKQPVRQPEADPLTELREAYDRLFADFRNYKRHAERDLAEARETGRDELVRALIPVLADLEAASRANGGDAEAVRRGVRMIRLKLDDILAQAGYDRVDTAQGRMDPRVHEAIAVIPTAGAEDGRILQELSPGYTRNGQLVHPARVTVAKGRPTRTGAGHENPRDGRIPHAVSEADGG